MNPTARNPLMGLGALLGRIAGSQVAGRRIVTPNSEGGRNAVLAGLSTDLIQSLAGGRVVTLLFWGITAFTTSGYSPGGIADLSSLMRPRVFPGNFFVPLSVVVYTLVGGLMLGPVFGPLVNRAARAGAEGEVR